MRSLFIVSVLLCLSASWVSAGVNDLGTDVPATAHSSSNNNNNNNNMNGPEPSSITAYTQSSNKGPSLQESPTSFPAATASSTATATSFPAATASFPAATASFPAATASFPAATASSASSNIVAAALSNGVLGTNVPQGDSITASTMTPQATSTNSATASNGVDSTSSPTTVNIFNNQPVNGAPIANQQQQETPQLPNNHVAQTQIQEGLSDSDDEGENKHSNAVRPTLVDTLSDTKPTFRELTKEKDDDEEQKNIDSTSHSKGEEDMLQSHTSSKSDATRFKEKRLSSSSNAEPELHEQEEEDDGKNREQDVVTKFSPKGDIFDALKKFNKKILDDLS